jgi:hypothetical protein
MTTLRDVSFAALILLGGGRVAHAATDHNGAMTVSTQQLQKHLKSDPLPIDTSLLHNVGGYTVEFSVTVDEHGNVVDVSSIRSTSGIVSQSIAASISRRTYRPFLRNGKAVRIWADLFFLGK